MFWCHSWWLKMFSVTFDFKCKYIKQVQYNCSAHHFVHLFIIARSSHSHKEQKESQFFFPVFFRHSDWIWKDINMERYLYSVRMQEEGLHLRWKETPTQVLTCEYCKIFKNSFFCRTPEVVSNSRGVFRAVKHLQRSFSAKTVKAYKSLTIFAKKLNCRYLTGF